MKLPNKLLLTIARYYINRSNQDKIKWNKEADLDFIEKNCPEGMSYSAISGTFWFSKGKKKVEINESNFCEHVQLTHS